MAVCERINERVRTKSGGYTQAILDLSDKQLSPFGIGHLIRCFDENQVRPKILKLSGNKLIDFDLANAVGFFIESVSGRFLTELDLSENEIGDFGAICILQSLVTNKLRSSERRITILRVNNNLITHPARIVEAVPENLRHLIHAPGFSTASMDQALIYIYGMDDQRVPRAKRDGATSSDIPLLRPGIREPDSD